MPHLLSVEALNLKYALGEGGEILLKEHSNVVGLILSR